MTNPKAFLATSTAMTVTLTGIPAIAQTASETDGAAAYGEILVTARKRQESILDVPVVENVISQEAIENYQINSLDDVTTKIPGLSAAMRSWRSGNRCPCAGLAEPIEGHPESGEVHHGAAQSADAGRARSAFHHHSIASQFVGR